MFALEYVEEGLYALRNSLGRYLGADAEGRAVATAETPTPECHWGLSFVRGAARAGSSLV